MSVVEHPPEQTAAPDQTPARWWRRALPPPGTDLEVRLFQMVCLIGSGMAFGVVIPFNLMQTLSIWISIATGAFGLFATWLWYESRRGRQRPVAMFLVFMGLLDAIWFLNGGAHSSIPFYFFDAVLLPVLFCRRWTRALLLAVFFLNVLALYGLEYLHPEWVVGFATPLDRTYDIVTGFVICAIALVAMGSVVVRSYFGERANLVESNRRLQQSLEEVRTLRGLLPICSWCKKVRDDAGLWTQIEQYVSTHTEAAFTHGMCPDCYDRVHADLYRHRTGGPGPTAV